MKYLKSFNESLKLSNSDYYHQLGELINSKLPKSSQEFIRLWRGNRPGESGKNPSYTLSLEGIALPFYYGYLEGGQDSDITYIDIPKKDLKNYEIVGGVEGEEFILPKDLLSQVKIVDKNIYRNFEDANLPRTSIPIGGLSSFDNFADNFLKF